MNAEHKKSRIKITSMLKGNETPRSMGLGILFTTIKFVIVVIILVGAAGIGLVLGVAKAYIDTTPMLELSALTDSSKTSYIYDCNGEVICTYAGLEYRDWASIEEIPDMLQNAVIAIEDVRFKDHSGVDYKRLISAVINTFRNEDTHGGSTITQQLIKNTILSDVQSYKRKIQEAYLALELETVSNKDKILEAYLNEIYFGDHNYGIKAAAKDYFGKELSELTIRECAMLAGMIQKPNGYNPRLNMYVRIDEETGENQMERTDKRTNLVINAMYDAGFISLEQRDKALAEEVTIIKESTKSHAFDYTYFIEYAIYDVETHLLKQRGLPDTSSNRSILETEIRTGGYQIYLTIDPKIQQIVETEVENYNNYPKLINSSAAVRKEKQPDGTVLEIIEPQAAAVVMDHSTGYVVAVVGGRTKPTAQKQWNRAYMSALEVGSSIKPIAVYGPALDSGVSPASAAYNIPGAIRGWDTDAGYPSIGSSSPDVVSIRRGVRSSLNIVAARTLMYEVGIKKSKEYLENLGIPSKNINADGPGLALGTTGITPIQMAAAYSTIANNGVYQEPLSFSKVVDSNGRIILDAAQIRDTHRVFKESTSWLLVDMMKDVVSSGTGTKARLSGFTVAGKTGTNSDYSSVCFSGMTGYYVGTVWIGHDYPEFKLANHATGGVYAAPLWKNFMEKIHEGLEDKDIVDATPESLGLVRRTVCSVSGMLATDACYKDSSHSPITDWFTEENLPKQKCDVHTIVSICTESGMRAGEHCPSVESKSMVVVTNNSPLHQFRERYLTSIFSNLLLADSIDSIPVCNIHNAGNGEGANNGNDTENDTDFETLKKEAASIIYIVDNGMSSLSAEQQSKLKIAITQLKLAIKVESVPAVIETMDSLKKLYTEYTGYSWN